jgi:putative membrane protein
VRSMRFIQAVVFLVFLGAVAFFALQNTQVVTVQFMNWSVSAPVALTILSVYLLGMLSGWTVVAFVGRSIRRIGESDR